MILQVTDQRFHTCTRRYSQRLLVRFFDDPGYICFMICAKGTPISSPVIKLRSTLPMKSPCTLSVSRRFSSAFSGVTSRHSAGGCLRCRLRESLRAKKSPQCSQNEISSGCASVVLQWRLKLSHLLNPLVGQSRHLISSTALRVQSASVAASSIRNSSKSLGISKRWPSCFSVLAMWCDASSTLSSTLGSWCSCTDGHHPTLLETRSQQGTMVYSLHIGGREPLRSAPCLLGYPLLFVGNLVSGVRWALAPDHATSRFPLQGPPLTRLWGGITSTTGSPLPYDSSASRRRFPWATPDMDVVAGTTSTFLAVAEMDDAAGYLYAVLMMLADSPLFRWEREDTHEVTVGPRRAINSARFAPCSDTTDPVSLLPPGPGMGMEEWTDCSGSRSQVNSSGDGAGFATLLGPGSN